MLALFIAGVACGAILLLIPGAWPFMLILGAIVLGSILWAWCEDLLAEALWQKHYSEDPRNPDDGKDTI